MTKIETDQLTSQLWQLARYEETEDFEKALKAALLKVNQQEHELCAKVIDIWPHKEFPDNKALAGAIRSLDT